MKNFALFLLIMIALAVVIVPYGDGYLTKRAFMAQMANSQAMLDSQHSDMTLKVTNYKMGWLKSNATVTMSGTIPANTPGQEPTPFEFPFDLVIHHGPLLLIDNKPTLGLAYVEAFLRIPSAWESMIPNGKDIYLKVTSFLTMDQKTTITNFFIPAFNVGPKFKWDGLTGNSTVNMNGHVLGDAKSSITIGRMSGDISELNASFTVDPIKNDMVITKSDDENNNSTATVKVGSINVNMQGKSAFKLKSIDFTVTNSVKAGLYNSQFDVVLNNLESPFIKPVNDITMGKYSINVSNLNYDALKKFSTTMEGINSKYSNIPATAKLAEISSDDITAMSGAALAILNAKSTAENTINIDTSLGKFSMLINLTLNDMPKKLDEVKDKINSKVEIRISKKLLVSLAQFAAEQQINANKTNKVTTPAAEPQPTKNIYIQGVADLVMGKMITAEQSISIMAIADQHPTTEADLDAALTTLALPKETTDKIRALYISQYMPQTPAAAEPASEPTDPIILAQMNIDDAIKKGILIDDGDAYTISFRKTGTEMKLNGSTDNPLLSVFNNGFGVEPMPATTAGASGSKEVSDLLMLIQGIAAAADGLSQKDGSYTNANMTEANIAALLPNGKLSSPWGSGITLSNQTKDTYTITIKGVPASLCKELQAKLAANTSFSENNKCDSSEPADFSYQYKSSF